MTAVEWLEEELKANLKKVILEGDSELMESLFEQAKEMEKEQIVTAQPLNQNKMKSVFTFLSVFLFTQICGIYIMGGFDHQTIYSKVTSVSLGVVFGIAAIYIKHELNKSE